MIHSSRSTDWDAYYRRPFAATGITRQFTTNRLLRHMTPHVTPGNCQLVEWGGANSCFMDAVRERFQPTLYTVCDTNELGLERLRQRTDAVAGVRVLNDDVLAPKEITAADLVFSVGLIEHFDAASTAQAIESHFASARSGGVIVITFPTPTWLYRFARHAAECSNQWPFHDERPLTFPEVRRQMDRWGECLAIDLIWPIVFTQGVCVYRKR